MSEHVSVTGQQLEAVRRFLDLLRHGKERVPRLPLLS